ncbi:hypothetical protein LSTR_LSTR017410 [Laodelphax striatellus]|uniref:Uncharacterized protein n=1 Tax=Laodelphax striatellus TaxID=195883 RepID=A0A482WT29_LAOST|nr:hypothetical protein LSTR_LSTR017410 [Laodelphax striatellus]
MLTFSVRDLFVSYYNPYGCGLIFEAMESSGLSVSCVHGHAVTYAEAKYHHHNRLQPLRSYCGGLNFGWAKAQAA